MRRFWSYHGWEGLLCLAVSASLVLNFAQGFYIPAAVADSVPLALLVCGVTLLCAYLGSYNRVTIACAFLGFGALAACFFLWMRGAGIDIVDEEGSDTAVYIYCIAAPLIALIVFLLTRSRPGTAVLFVLGGCLHGLIDFLGYAVKPWCAAIFALAVPALFMLRQYRATALRGSTVEPAFGRFFGLAAAVSLAGMLLGLSCWAAIIRPLNPPTADMELLTKYMSYEVLEVVGIARQYPMPDEEERAQTADQTVQGSQLEQEEEGPPQTQDPDTQEETDDTAAAAEPGAVQPGDTEAAGSVTYDRDLTGWLILLAALAAALVASVPVLRRLLRRRRMARLTSGSPVEQVTALYRFYLRQFGRIGFPRGPAQTEWEYARRYGEQLAPYLEGGPNLAWMTGLYMDARYGGIPASEEDCRTMAELYPIFLRRYRELAGRVRYLTKYFLL